MSSRQATWSRLDSRSLFSLWNKKKDNFQIKVEHYFSSMIEFKDQVPPGDITRFFGWFKEALTHPSMIFTVRRIIEYYAR